MRSALVLVVMAACNEPMPPPAGTNPRFVGEWMIDQPSHATYEASWYEFHEDGRLEHLRDCTLGGPVPTGFVSDASQSVRCEFGARWSALDAETLVIDGVCDDGLERALVLAFPAVASGNAAGLFGIDVVSVGGEGGWGHFTFEWAWQKCAEDGCPPVLGQCP
jgi:hypothetical protein